MNNSGGIETFCCSSQTQTTHLLFRSYLDESTLLFRKVDSCVFVTISQHLMFTNCHFDININPADPPRQLIHVLIGHSGTPSSIFPLQKALTFLLVSLLCVCQFYQTLLVLIWFSPTRFKVIIQN